MLGQMSEPVDGFLLSGSLCYLPTTYRAHVLAQMEVLRLANGYRNRQYLAPIDSDQPVPAFGQLEYQIRVQPGAYLWGLEFTLVSGDVEVGNIRIQITDDCTETLIFSDYALAVSASPDSGASIISKRNPFMINPRMIGEPGTMTVELYNSSANEAECQLVMLMAEPCLPTEEMKRIFAQRGATS